MKPTSDCVILQTIQTAFNNVTGRSDIKLMPETVINNGEWMTSFTVMELIIELEEAFNIELSYSSIRSVKKVQNLINIIKENL